MDLRRYQLANNQQGAMGTELVTSERSLAMVRKLAMALSKADPPYVESQIFPSKRTGAEDRRKTVNFTRYRLTEKNFVRWPRTGVFLLECRNFARDENGTIGILEFADHLKINHGFTDMEFKEDWEYVLPREYIHLYGARFSTGRRIDAELQWLDLLARARGAKTSPRRTP